MTSHKCSNADMSRVWQRTRRPLALSKSAAWLARMVNGNSHCMLRLCAFFIKWSSYLLSKDQQDRISPVQCI